jgi:lipoprotein-releasing system ATP-binding protein
MILIAKKISKSYPNVNIFSELDLEIKQGQSVAICGRSGEGKTTLLHILGTLEEPDSGIIEINGQQLTRSNASALRNKHIGFIFQSYNLLEDFTVLDNVLMPARIARKTPDKNHGMELLRQVGLQDRAQSLAKFLSGGERQRVAIARALCNNPDLIFADEPTGNLDKANAKKVGELLLSLNKTLILVTHDPELASLCNQSYTLSGGKLF